VERHRFPGLIKPDDRLCFGGTSATVLPALSKQIGHESAGFFKRLALAA
jgi:hypothetical protein